MRKRVPVRILEYGRAQARPATRQTPEEDRLRSGAMVRCRGACGMDLGGAVAGGSAVDFSSVHGRARSAENRGADPRQVLSETLRVRTARTHFAGVSACGGGGGGR